MAPRRDARDTEQPVRIRRLRVGWGLGMRDEERHALVEQRSQVTHRRCSSLRSQPLDSGQTLAAKVLLDVADWGASSRGRQAATSSAKMTGDPSSPRVNKAPTELDARPTSAALNGDAHRCARRPLDSGQTLAARVLLDVADRGEPKKHGRQRRARRWQAGQFAARQQSSDRARRMPLIGCTQRRRSSWRTSVA